MCNGCTFSFNHLSNILSPVMSFACVESVGLVLVRVDKITAAGLFVSMGK